MKNFFSNELFLDNTAVGLHNPVYVIAEAGISHFGNEEKAYELIEMAVQARANAVKFQIFDVKYLYENSQKEWINRLGSRQLPYSSFENIYKYCKKKKITFFATAHDEPSLDFLCFLKVPFYKIGSGELNNFEFINKIASFKKPVIFSTGMYTLDDIKNTLNIFKDQKNPDIIALHCNTSYPTKPSEVYLKNIQLINERFDIVTGYSDHTKGYHIPLASVLLGAKVIEKHISLDFNVKNAQDWKVSCGPEDLKKFITELREIEETIKNFKTEISSTEKESKIWATKSLHLLKSLKKGSSIVKEHIISQRPGNGIPPSKINSIIGKKIKKNLAAGALLKWSDIE